MQKKKKIDENTKLDCSVIIPNKETLLPKLKSYYYITSLKINNENISMQIINFINNPFNVGLNSGDKEDITTKIKKEK